uniref:Uncharacterized protein n=1 Tax=Lepeophtheirus salmonis TaxID=72036 RepID=A0A0K2T5T6_LEPSM
MPKSMVPAGFFVLKTCFNEPETLS